jgi:hypothetical protein
MKIEEIGKGVKREERNSEGNTSRSIRTGRRIQVPSEKKPEGFKRKGTFGNWIQKNS